MKRSNGPSIFCAVLLFFAVLVSSASAEMKAVDDAEMASTIASLGGAPVNDGKVPVPFSSKPRLGEDVSAYMQGLSEKASLERQMNDSAARTARQSLHSGSGSNITAR